MKQKITQKLLCNLFNCSTVRIQIFGRDMGWHFEEVWLFCSTDGSVLLQPVLGVPCSPQPGKKSTPKPSQACTARLVWQLVWLNKRRQTQKRSKRILSNNGMCLKFRLLISICFPTHLKDETSRSPRSFMANPFRGPLRQVAIEIVKYELAETLTP